MVAPNNEVPARPVGMTPEERLDALAAVFAEGFVMIAESGGLDDLLAPSAPTPVVEPGKKGAVDSE